MKQPKPLPSGPFFRLLIPEEPRNFPGERWGKITARGLHVVLAGIYLGALVFEVDAATRTPWFLATLFSGLAMLCVDLYGSGAFLLQTRGLVLGTKLVLLALLPTFGDAAVWVLAWVAFFSVISSHASSKFRYFLIWGRGRIKASETRG